MSVTCIRAVVIVSGPWTYAEVAEKVEVARDSPVTVPRQEHGVRIAYSRRDQNKVRPQCRPRPGTSLITSSPPLAPCNPSSTCIAPYMKPLGSPISMGASWTCVETHQPLGPPLWDFAGPRNLRDPMPLEATGNLAILCDPWASVVCDRDRRGADHGSAQQPRERVLKIWEDVSAGNSGREWSARFHSWLLQGSELTGALVLCNAATGFFPWLLVGGEVEGRRCHLIPRRRESRRIWWSRSCRDTFAMSSAVY